eukprot:TRINITY_DN79291_c0_g1_i1.p1 TRINITY_DN79291_c0_g1~~TRINITY_DN79291_c0_g1_i1.p1  ORF type:complete len:342 (-),score=68.68 TRINITY_DN79291_c0_g1_i1:152-1177(-)
MSDSESDDGPRGTATVKINPLDIRFSQRKMRNVFQDGQFLADSAELVVAHPLPKGSECEAKWLLQAPFPPIEVVRWTCKLRDESTGRPMIDPHTGDAMYDTEDRWYTLDNRRLYCLQRAAAKLYPDRCVADVIAEVHKDRRLRELRKFRTLDSGKSINIGSRVDGVDFQEWCWEDNKGEAGAASAAKVAGQGSGGTGGKGKDGGKSNSSGKGASKGNGQSKGDGQSKGGYGKDNGKGKGKNMWNKDGYQDYGASQGYNWNANWSWSGAGNGKGAPQDAYAASGMDWWAAPYSAEALYWDQGHDYWSGHQYQSDQGLGQGKGKGKGKGRGRGKGKGKGAVGE